MKLRYAELAKTFCCINTDIVKVFKIEKGFGLIWNADFDCIICLLLVSLCLFSSLNSKTSNLALLNKTLSLTQSTCWFKSLLSVIWVGKINFYYQRREKEEIDFTFENIANLLLLKVFELIFIWYSMTSLLIKHLSGTFIENLTDFF